MAYTGLFPNQYIPEVEMTDEWYKDCVRGGAANYNFILGDQNSNTQQPLRFADLAAKGISYFFQIQPNLNYAYVQQSGVLELSTPWLKGGQAYTLVSNLSGRFSELIDAAQVSTKSISKETASRKSELIEKEMLKFDMKPILDKLQEEHGIGFNPSGQNFESQADIPRYFNEDYKETSEKVAKIIGDHIWYRNNLDGKYKKAADYMICTGLCGVKIDCINNEIVHKQIPAYAAIWDNSVDNDNGVGARYGGMNHMMSINEIIAQYGKELKSRYGQTCIDEIQNYQTSGVLPDNTGWNYPTVFGTTGEWWRQNRGTLFGQVTELEWLSFKDLKYYKGNKDPYGNERLRKLRTDKVMTESITQIRRKGTLIMNKYLVDFGECTNHVRGTQPKDSNKSDTCLSYQFYTPRLMGGYIKSLVMRIADYQDRLDLYDFKINEWVAAAKGRKYIFDTSQVTDGQTSKEVIDDLANAGIANVNRSTGDENNPADKRPLMEAIEFPLVEFDKLVMLREAYKTEMEAIVSVPKVSLGLQTNLIGKSVQQNTQASASFGVRSYFDGFQKWCSNVMWYSVETAKVALTSEGDYEGAFMLGDRNIQFLKVTKEFKFEDFDTAVEMGQAITPEERQILLDGTFAAMQNQQIDWVDYIKLQTFKTYSEAVNYAEYTDAKRKKAAQEQQDKALQIQQATLESQNQQSVMKETGQDSRQEMKSQTDLAKTLIQEDNKQAATQ